MVAREAGRLRQAAEESLAVQGDVLCLAVDDPPCLDDLPAVRGPDGLVTQAYSQDGHRACEALDGLHADPGLLGPPGSRGYDDPRRLHGDDLIHGDLVIAVH